MEDKIQQIEDRLKVHSEHLKSIQEALRNGDPINDEFSAFTDEVFNTYWLLPSAQ